MILRPCRKIRLISGILIPILVALCLILTIPGCREDSAYNRQADPESSVHEDTIGPTEEPETGQEIAGEVSVEGKDSLEGSPEEDLKEPEVSGPEGEDVKEEPIDDKDDIIFSFTVTGDSRPADDHLPMPDTFLTILGLIKDEESSFNISVGDIINGQTEDDELVIRAFSDYLAAVEGVYPVNFVSPGNHDIINDTTRKYFREMILDKSMADALNANIDLHNPLNQDGLNSYYYYFSLDDIYFVVLNAFEPGYWGSVKDGQLEWLEGVLEGLKDEVVFVTIHTPPYSFINPDTITDGSKQVGFSDRENLEHIRGLFKDYTVDAVFSGHEHVYNKEFHDGTHYIITALAGEYPYFPEDQGGFYHYIRVDIEASGWVYNVIGIDGDLRYREEVQYN